ncbi:seed maturation protein [Wolffia australiana]
MDDDNHKGIVDLSVVGRLLSENIRVVNNEPLGGRSVVALIQDMVLGYGSVTVGEALEAAAQVAGKKLVDFADAAAIQSAMGSASPRPGDVASRAQAAARVNSRLPPFAEGITLQSVLLGVQNERIMAERQVTAWDAKKVAKAEAKNKANKTTCLMVVASCMAAAARLNGCAAGSPVWWARPKGKTRRMGKPSQTLLHYLIGTLMQDD